MVLEDLGASITKALAGMASKAVIDEDAVNAMLKDLQRALLLADVNVALVQKLSKNVKETVMQQISKAEGVNRRVVVEKTVFAELVHMLDSGVPEKSPDHPRNLKKGVEHVVMFVGLQGAGKTTTIMKYAFHYKKQGFKPGLVCADTYRAGALDQLKQNASKIGVPFYGSYEETDPARLVRDGLRRLRDARRDLLIVDTSGRHKQSDALFEEMRAVAAVANPTLTVFVMDGSIGQAAFDQADAFRRVVDVGAVVMTKMDGHAKGGGALSAVAATKSPIIFIGTGEHVEEFEPFSAKSFVSRMLGRGDLEGLMNKFQETLANKDLDTEGLMKQIAAGKMSLRIFRQQTSQLASMGPMSQVVGMIPGLSQLASMGSAGNDQTAAKKFKQYSIIMDSMTDYELDLDLSDIKVLRTPSRVRRIARGAGVTELDVLMFFVEYERTAGMIKTMSGMGGMLEGAGRGRGGLDARKMQQAMQMAGSLPPGLKNSLGGGGMPNMGSLMRNMQGLLGGRGRGGGGGGMPDLGSLASMLGRGGGRGGMPDLGALMGMAGGDAGAGPSSSGSGMPDMAQLMQMFKGGK